MGKSFYWIKPNGSWTIDHPVGWGLLILHPSVNERRAKGTFLAARLNRLRLPLVLVNYIGQFCTSAITDRTSIAISTGLDVYLRNIFHLMMHSTKLFHRIAKSQMAWKRFGPQVRRFRYEITAVTPRRYSYSGKSNRDPDGLWSSSHPVFCAFPLIDPNSGGLSYSHYRIFTPPRLLPRPGTASSCD